MARKCHLKFIYLCEIVKVPGGTVVITLQFIDLLQKTCFQFNEKVELDMYDLRLVDSVMKNLQE